MASTKLKPRFTTILSARGNHKRPSDLEFQLRGHCQRLKVVEQLSGAHLLFPGESSLAIRAYFPNDLEHFTMNMTEKTTRQVRNGDTTNNENSASFDSKTSGKMKSTNNKDHDGIQNGTIKHGDPELISNRIQEDDFDGLFAFFSFFKLTVAFFILPPNIQKTQLGDFNSIFHRAQRLMRSALFQEQRTNKMDKNVRIFLVPDTEAAVGTITALADSLQKKDIKKNYFQNQAIQNFLPQPDGVIPESCSAAAAQHVAEALRQWADRFELPPGEINVLMSLLGTLRSIASANDHILDSVPIEDYTKRVLHAFFGSAGRQDEDQNMDHYESTQPTTNRTRPYLHNPTAQSIDTISPVMAAPFYPDTHNNADFTRAQHVVGSQSTPRYGIRPYPAEEMPAFDPRTGHSPQILVPRNPYNCSFNPHAPPMQPHAPLYGQNSIKSYRSRQTASRSSRLISPQQKIAGTSYSQSPLSSVSHQHLPSSNSFYQRGYNM